MWAFLSRRLRRWMMLMVALPVAAWALERLGGELERRRGPSRGSRALRDVSGLIRSRGRGRRA